MENKLQEANRKLADVFKKLGINKFVVTSLGNSIGAGYSMVRKTMPLLLRNQTLNEIMKLNDIDIDVHHFARAQNNNDEHVLEWITSNIKESEMHRRNLGDFSGGPSSMPEDSLSDKEKEEYYPTNIENDKGLNDVIRDFGLDMANVVIYNGATGSFLDNLTRGGKLKNQFLYGVKRDIKNMESVLSVILTNNRLRGSNTQVYLCGAPDFLGLKISGIINRKLKKLALNYANVTYVEPVKSKLFYKPLETETPDKAQGLFAKFLGTPDIHYDEEEYLRFNTNIINSISSNYMINMALINLDKELYALSKTIETKNQDLRNNSELINEIVNIFVTRESDKLDEKDKNEFYQKANDYILQRFPYDFFYIGKDAVKNSLGIR